MSKKVHDVTDFLPEMEPKTRSNVKKGATLALGAFVALLLVDDQVKRFKRRKNVTVTVEDTGNDS